MRKYKSKIAAAVHEAMQDVRYAGVIDKCTMRQFDASCLTPAELLSAREIQRLRKREGVSQSVLLATSMSRLLCACLGGGGICFLSARPNR